MADVDMLGLGLRQPRWITTWMEHDACSGNRLLSLAVRLPVLRCGTLPPIPRAQGPSDLSFLSLWMCFCL